MTSSDSAPSKQTPETAPKETKSGLSAHEELRPFAVGISNVGMEAHKKFMASLAIPEGRTKQETYDEALEEQKEFGTELVGFENDEDFEGLIDQMVGVFGQDALDRCLIDRIIYDSNHVLLQDNGHHYEIPAEEYVALRESLPEVEQHRVRAFNTANQNIHPASKRYQRMPIAIYSFAGESIESKDYLPEHLSDEEKMRVYKLGTVVHEIAHGVRFYLLDDEEWQEWESLNREVPSLTQYANQHVDKGGWSEEQFSEAVRLYATNRRYLEGKSPEIVQFLESKLPSLNPDSLTDNGRRTEGSYDTNSKEAGWDSPKRAQKLVEPYVTSGTRVLDVGIGTGQAVNGYVEKGATVVGLDHDKSMLSTAKSVVGENSSLREADINEHLPIDDLKESVDVAQAIGVLEFAEDLPSVLEQVHGSLKENGVFVFTCELVDGVRTTEKQTHFPDADITVHRRSVEEIQTLLAETGYILLGSDTYDGYERGDGAVPYGIFLAQKKYKRVEQGRLAHIRQTHNSDFESWHR
jgi:SAM-dependent methyltransferase